MEKVVDSAPAVSVIMNCYNSAQYLAEAIDSVVAQTFMDWEIIFFDNCSTDESPAIAKRYDSRLRYFRGETNVPLGHARNLAMAQARGRYIAFLDCDDVWYPSKLDVQVKVMQANPELGATFSDALFFGTAQAFRTFPNRKPSQGMIFRDLLRRYVLPMPTIMIRQEVLEHIGGHFDERFHMVEDADLFMRLAFYYPIAYVDDVLAKRRMHEASWTAMKKELFPKEEEMLLAKFAALWPSFEKDFAVEIRHMKAIIAYQHAVLDWEKGDNKEARRRMAPYLSILKKMWVPFVFSYFPIELYKYVKRTYKKIIAPLLGSVDDQAF
jgi:glycosyltransferase involved in cell wall biosynthesis